MRKLICERGSYMIAQTILKNNIIKKINKPLIKNDNKLIKNITSKAKIN